MAQKLVLFFVLVCGIFITLVASERMCTDRDDGSYIADPYDCESFYLCIMGRAMKHRCPIGLHFNRYTMVIL